MPAPSLLMLAATAPWAVLAPCVALAAQSPTYEVPDGFRVERVSDAARSYLSMTFDGELRLHAGVEDGGILRFEDEDWDGKLEPATFTDRVTAVQGMVWRGETLFAVGRCDDRDGLWRIERQPDGSAGEPKLFAPIAPANGSEPPGEHGAHGIVVGPDGFLYWMLGNYAKLGTEPVSTSPLRVGYEGTLLPPLYDPLGYGLGVRYPAGYVARVDPETAAWRYVSVGLRNCYDLAFNAEGELFTWDSDMEWDAGLPWYRPPRFLHLIEGGDYGARTGSYNWPSYYFDSLPPIVETARASPTGMCFYEHRVFPERYRGALLAGDWANGRIVALHLQPNGATYAGEVETLLQAKGSLQITDLEVGLDGAVYFVSGGRGTLGYVEKLTYGRPTSAPARDIEFALTQPESAWRRSLLDAACGDSKPAYADQMRSRALDAQLHPAVRVGAFDEVLRVEDRTVLPLLSTLAADANPSVRARAAFWLGELAPQFAGADLVRRLEQLVRDSQPRVARRALCAMLGNGIIDPNHLFPAVIHADPCVRYAARQVLVSNGPYGMGDSIDRDLDPSQRFTLPHSESEVWFATANRFESSHLYTKEALALIADNWFARKEQEALDIVRLLSLDVQRDGAARYRPSQSNGVTVDRVARVFKLFPSDYRSVSRELAMIMAQRDPARAIAPLLHALAAETERSEQIHYAYCLSAIESGWTRDQARQLFAWFDVAETWTGGLSFNGYMLAMRARLASRFSSSEKIAMANEAPMGARTLARFAAELTSDEIDALVKPLQYAWHGLAKDREEDELENERADVLAALGGARSPKLAEWLRKLVDDPSAPADAARAALARSAYDEDWPTLLVGLESDQAATVDASAKALARIERRPTTSDAFAKLHRALREAGSGRANELSKLFEHWSGDELATESLDVALATVESWIVARFPDVELEPADDSGPRWTHDQLLAFLERSSARPGDPRRGFEVYKQASCVVCHPYDGAPEGPRDAGLGPELSTVAQRFDRRALLEAIVFPSRAVADLYRATSVTTRDEQRVEGRLVEDRADAIVLLSSTGARIEIARDQIDALAPAKLSLMPDGLMRALDLEQVKDLFAFLDARGAVDWSSTPTDFEPLFAGKARNQWSGERDLWILDGERVTGRASSLAGNSYLVSKRTWSDFELAFDVRLSPGANSGVQLRSRLDPNAPDPIGLQADLGQSFWGSLYATDGRGLVAAADATLAREVVDPTGWNHVFVRARGERITIELNGATTVDVQDATAREGHLAFQLHQRLDMQIEIVGAKLRELR